LAKRILDPFSHVGINAKNNLLSYRFIPMLF
jgi:hypothetical protein